MVWEWKPIVFTELRYFLGAEKYVDRFCWPGKSPFYTPFNEFPSNPLWAFNEMYKQINLFLADYRVMGTTTSIPPPGTTP